MLIYFVLYFSVMYLAKRIAGRNSPIWGVSAIFSKEIVGWIFIILFSPLFMSEKGLIIFASVVSSLTVFVIYGVIFIFLDKKNIRELPKNSVLNYKAVGWVFLVIFPILGVVTGAYTEQNSNLNGGSEAVIIIFLSLIVAAHSFKFYKMQRSPSIEEKLLDDERKPVLLLRAFENEKLRTGIKFELRKCMTNSGFIESRFAGYSYDELLSPCIDQYMGPSIALGNPLDYLPSLGSSKSYLNDNDWKEKVEYYINEAQYVVILEGDSENMAWELGRVRSQKEPHSVYILTYPELYSKLVKRDESKLWSKFVSLLQGVDIQLPENDPGCGTIITFDENWSYVLLGSKIEAPEESVNIIVANNNKIQSIFVRHK